MPGRSRLLAACLVFSMLAIVHTWPLATDPAHLSRNDNGDALLNTWIVSWVAHQLPRNPLRLFDANIFHPEKGTLAFSEPLIVPGILGTPLRWLGASPVLTFNLLLLAGFVLTAMGMYVLVVSATGHHLAGLFAGSVLVFNAHTLTRLPHLQAAHAAGLPLALWALDRLLTGARTRDALWLTLFVVSLAYTSGYLSVFVAVALVAAWVARPEDWWGPRRWPVLGRLALAGALSLLLILPVIREYREVRRDQNFARSLGSVDNFSATHWTYVNTISRVHYATWSDRVYRVRSREKLFPGFMTLALAVVALSRRRALADRRVRMFVAIAVGGFLLSLGTNNPLYPFIYAIAPPIQGLRAVARFGILVILATAALAGFGLAHLASRFGTRRWWPAAAIAAIVVVNLEALHAPYDYERFEGIPPIYDSLADDDEVRAVVEFPFYYGNSVFGNAVYMLNSTAHWKPLVNGYSGFEPRSFGEISLRLQSFPDEASIAELHRLGVSHVIIHHRHYSARRQRRIDGAIRSGILVRLAAGDNGITLYRLRPSADS